MLVLVMTAVVQNGVGAADRSFVHLGVAVLLAPWLPAWLLWFPSLGLPPSFGLRLGGLD